MNELICIVFVIAIMNRLNFYFISKKNEKRLLKKGGKEYGKECTRALATIHTVFYFASFVEGYFRRLQCDTLCLIGICLITVSFMILMLVMNDTGKYWTIKIILADDSILNTNWLLRYSKYPNYYINAVPELLGITLLFHSWFTMFVFILPYSICLYLRISQEKHLIDILK